MHCHADGTGIFSPLFYTPTLCTKHALGCDKRERNQRDEKPKGCTVCKSRLHYRCRLVCGVNRFRVHVYKSHPARVSQSTTHNQNSSSESISWSVHLTSKDVCSTLESAVVIRCALILLSFFLLILCHFELMLLHDTLFVAFTLDGLVLRRP